eukprot:Nk52_evm46s32 gene=Nk52_evmTU46s32
MSRRSDHLGGGGGVGGGASSGSGAGISSGSSNSGSGKSSNICRYFANDNYCAYGDSCNFQHTTPSSGAAGDAGGGAGSGGSPQGGQTVMGGSGSGIVKADLGSSIQGGGGGAGGYRKPSPQRGGGAGGAGGGGFQGGQPPMIGGGAPPQSVYGGPQPGMGYMGGDPYSQPPHMGGNPYMHPQAGGIPAPGPAPMGGAGNAGYGVGKQGLGGAAGGGGAGGGVMHPQQHLMSGFQNMSIGGGGGARVPGGGAAGAGRGSGGGRGGGAGGRGGGGDGESMGGTVYFYPPGGQRGGAPPPQQAPAQVGQQPVHHPVHGYVSPLPSVANPPGKEKILQSFFMSESLREELRLRNDLILQSVDGSQSHLPMEVDQYHSLYSLDNHVYEKSPKTFGFFTSCYKVISSFDGMPYCLRRIEGYRLTNEKTMVVVDQWKKVQHANIVTLRQVFTTKEFGDHSLAFVYDYHPGSETLMNRHFRVERKGFLQEAVLWSYIIQLTSALRAVHSSGLACRVIDPTKMIFTGKNRLRINCVCIYDILTFESVANKNVIPHFQQEDLIALGRLILALACNSLSALQRENFNQSVERISMHYSTDLKNLVVYLLASPQPHGRLKNVNDLMPMIGARFYTEIECLSLYNDVLEGELSKELENGRLFRLLSKLGFINERPEYDMDMRWADTGDRYILKLFRDYVFHQVLEDGSPVLDLGHVVQTLNKLDSGFQEKICLFSRDEQSILIVSFKDLKNCIERCFNELMDSAGN